MLWGHTKSQLYKTDGWRGFVTLFLGVFVGGVAALYLFVLLVDPYGIIPFSLPIERRIVSISDRLMYPQIVRSRRFDSLVIGTSTSKLLDPELLGRLFNVRFANLAMYSPTAWEEQAMLDLFIRTVGPPKVLIVGLDGVWCDPDADRNRITFRGFPDWLYGDQPWEGFRYLFNYGTLEIAGRLVGNQLGIYPERVRSDGYDVFVPPESQYDPVRAHDYIWQGIPAAPVERSAPLSAAERSELSFPALAWLDSRLTRLPATSQKILAFMPVHITAQPAPGTRAADTEAECKARIAMIGRKHGATVIDWRIPSPITRNDTNYWDRLHYRVPIATRIAEGLVAAVAGKESEDGSYILPSHEP
jgi:hypothetical protein